MGNILEQTIKASIFNSFEQKEIKKAYTEGIYCDSPANRKLGRVGMTYTEYTNKINGGSVDSDYIRDFKKEKVGGFEEYKAELFGKEIKVRQSGKQKNRSWIIEKNGEKLQSDKNIILRFKTPEEAINNAYYILEEENSGYKFPNPDYLYFKSVRWINPNDDEKMNTIHIHRYGKKKPEIVISSKDGLEQTNIVLKNSELRRLLVGITKKEDVSLNLDYSEEDMLNWSSNKKYISKEISLKYNADTDMISYSRIPKYIGLEQKFKFPASVLDRVISQFKNK